MERKCHFERFEYRSVIHLGKCLHHYRQCSRSLTTRFSGLFTAWYLQERRRSLLEINDSFICGYDSSLLHTLERFPSNPSTRLRLAEPARQIHFA
jgi:hypothetical protein